MRIFDNLLIIVSKKIYCCNMENPLELTISNSPQAGWALTFFCSQKSKQKVRPLCSLSLKMRSRFAKPAKLAVAFPVPVNSSQAISISAWPYSMLTQYRSWSLHSKPFFTAYPTRWEPTRMKAAISIFIKHKLS